MGESKLGKGLNQTFVRVSRGEDLSQLFFRFTPPSTLQHSATVHPTSRNMATRAKRRAPSTPVSQPRPPLKRLRNPTASDATLPHAVESSSSSSSSGSSKAHRPRKKNLAELPYHILLEIFLYASNRDFLHGWPDSAYLLQLSTMCRSFYEPAMSALYRNPPTVPAVRAHQLLQTLKQRPELGRKIKQLFFEIDPLLRLTTPGYGHFDISEFVRKCTGVKELWLAHHRVDRLPYKWTCGMTPSWKYPDALFDALEGVASASGAGEDAGRDMQQTGPIRLQSWRWNGLFSSDYAQEDIMRIHLQQSFRGLKRLSIIYLLDTGVRWVPTLSVLPELEELELECCNLAPDSFSDLATTASNLRLKALSLISCSTIESDWLLPLLLSPVCRRLERLAVVHCRSCDLAFLPALANTPQLKSLSYDGRYFATLESNDTKPAYDTLLPLSAEPRWPSALYSLKLHNLRKWSADEVETFLDSLVSAAPELPHMRELSLHCILDDLGWRERARVRDRYERILLHAFVRPSSVSAAAPDPLSPSQGIAGESPSRPRRRSTRTRVQPVADVSEEDSEYSGFCEPDRVDIKMDNARPTEMHFNEEDFLEENLVLTRASRATRGRGRGSRRGRRGGRGGTARAPSPSTVAATRQAGSDEETDPDEDYVD
jgi:hypothetical protein